jgi:hypothetical protein
VSPRGKETPEDQAPESGDNELRNSDNFLTIGEVKRVCRWITDRQHKRGALVQSRFVNLRRFSEMTGSVVIPDARSSGGPVSRTDIRTLPPKYLLQ